MKKILVIEDTKEVRENLCEILELDNYKVFAAENGKIGVQLAHDHQPDLILCDVMMPELDGFGVLKILNRTPILNHIPFIFLTAKSEKEDFRKGMGLGAEDYITKPFDDVELLTSIEMRIKKSEMLRGEVDNSSEGIQRFFSLAKAESEFKKLTQGKETRKYNAKDKIYNIGQIPRWLFYIEKGKVKNYVINEFGKELTTSLLGPGEFFGYFSLIDDQTYTNNAACLEDTTLRLIPKEDFSLLLFNNRDFAAKFIKLIANKTSQTESKLLDFAYSSVRKKIANALITYCKSIESSTDHGFVITTTRDEIASIAGTTKETVIRTLSDFKSEKVIDISGRSILVKSLEDLIKIIS